MPEPLRRAERWSWLVALAGGALWALCFGKQPSQQVPWLALVPLMLLLGQRRAALLGFLHGLSFWWVSIPWIAPTLESYGELPGWLSWLALLALAGYLALYHMLFAGLGRLLWLRQGAVAALGLPALWVALEWLQTQVLTGFAWNLAAYAWIAVAGALPLTAWIGPFGLSYVVVFANLGVARSIALGRWRPALVAVGSSFLMLTVGGRWASPRPTARAPAQALQVRLIQPNLELVTTWDSAKIERGLEKLFTLSRQACDRPGALLIWPESAAWPFSYDRDVEFRSRVERLAASGCPVLLNSTRSTPAGDHNSLLLITARGEEGRYDKRHLVPFGEYVPGGRWLPFVDKLARNAGEYVAGERLELPRWEGEQLAPAICFEVTFPEEVAESVRRGGSLLVTVTNDAWYGDSSAPWQHYRAARFRAAENGRMLLRAALTGVSAVVAADGSELELLGVGQEGVMASGVRGDDRLTPYTRAPWLVPLACWLVAAFAILMAAKEARK